MLEHGYMRHHFVVRVGISFCQLDDSVEKQQLAEVFRLMNFDGLKFGLLLVEQRILCQLDCLIKPYTSLEFVIASFFSTRICFEVSMPVR